MTSNLFSKPDAVLVPFDMNSQFAERYSLGLDLGATNDSTAIAVVRRLDRFPDKPVFQVGHLSRVALGTPYPVVVTHVLDMLSRPRFRGKTDLVIDATGVGRPVFDMFQGYGMSPIGVIITAGNATTRDGVMWHVPKINLVSRVQALLHDERLHIHKDIAEASVLVSELQNFRAEYSDSGHIRFNARSGAHDDLVLALAIALWKAHGDGESTFNNWISYAQRANGAAVANAAKSKLPPVKLQRPKHNSAGHLITLTGRNVAVADDGTIELSEEEARPLIQNGWTQVGAAA
jgi:hypothetical protein